MGSASSSAPRVLLLGHAGDEDLRQRLARHARDLQAADLIAARREHLPAIEALGLEGKTVRPFPSPITALIDELGRHGYSVLICSGDPGYFGLLSVIKRRLPEALVSVVPSPSSVSRAFALAGHSWEDALVVNLQGRPLPAGAVARARKVAVLTSPEHPPERVAREVLAKGARFDEVYLASRLGEGSERFARTTLEELASSTEDPYSVLVMVRGTSGANSAVLANAERYLTSVAIGTTPEGSLPPNHTKPAVRALVLSLAKPPPMGTFYDVGAGTGVVGLEVALSLPLLHVTFLDRDAEKCRRIAKVAEAKGVICTVLCAAAEEAIPGLGAPDAAFIGGGGAEVVEMAARSWPAARIVAAFARIEPALAARSVLGNLVELSERRAETLAGGTRFKEAYVTYVAWRDT